MIPPWTVASTLLQSARREPSGAWHGYAMQLAVWASWADADVAYPGAQVATATTALSRVTQHLVDVPLHEALADASDSGVLREVARVWREQRLPAFARMRLASTSMSGVDMDDAGRVVLWRRYRLRCAHYLPHVPMGHKCGRLHGHDFEVVLHALQSQDLPDHDALDAVWAPWHLQLNYQQLNGLPGLDNPTSEMLSSWLWQGLQPQLPGLLGVTVFETASCGAHFDGDVHRIWKDFSFDSATRLGEAPDEQAESRVHGHTYHLRLVLQAPLDPVMGWAIDFGDVKAAFAPVFKDFDHQPLFEREGLARGDTTAIAQAIQARAQGVLPALTRTVLMDSDGGGCELSNHAAFLPLPL